VSRLSAIGRPRPDAGRPVRPVRSRFRPYAIEPEPDLAEIATAFFDWPSMRQETEGAIAERDEIVEPEVAFWAV
jgi:hypothetical protein